jgi:hypothetical protein
MPMLEAMAAIVTLETLVEKTYGLYRSVYNYWWEVPDKPVENPVEKHTDPY